MCALWQAGGRRRMRAHGCGRCGAPAAGQQAVNTCPPARLLHLPAHPPPSLAVRCPAAELRRAAAGRRRGAALVWARLRGARAHLPWRAIGGAVPAAVPWSALPVSACTRGSCGRAAAAQHEQQHCRGGVPSRAVHPSGSHPGAPRFGRLPGGGARGGAAAAARRRRLLGAGRGGGGPGAAAGRQRRVPALWRLPTGGCESGGRASWVKDARPAMQGVLWRAELGAQPVGWLAVPWQPARGGSPTNKVPLAPLLSHPAGRGFGAGRAEQHAHHARAPRRRGPGAARCRCRAGRLCRRPAARLLFLLCGARPGRAVLREQPPAEEAGAARQRAGAPRLWAVPQVPLPVGWDLLPSNWLGLLGCIGLCSCRPGSSGCPALAWGAAPVGWDGVDRWAARTGPHPAAQPQPHCCPLFTGPLLPSCFAGCTPPAAGACPAAAARARAWRPAASRAAAAAAAAAARPMLRRAALSALAA